ncbi:hypothetical protein MTR_3g097190 [Medicago truncatula]|uniref:Uncharacterized protein n=1 Tax=Medicago truncatula TaxID=3880 RepID=A0A072V1B8_MEDTR|nr:hypothetical protein MTR_3g097190 [Medicago truncatula]
MTHGKYTAQEVTLSKLDPDMPQCYGTNVGEFGVKKLWTKLFTLRPLGCIEHPIGEGMNGNLFFRRKDDELVWFNLSTEMIEAAENQSSLLRNLMCLAAIADSQPQPPTTTGQYPSSGMMQQGGHCMQAQQAQQMTQQQLLASFLRFVCSTFPTAASLAEPTCSSTGDGLHGTSLSDIGSADE